MPTKPKDISNQKFGSLTAISLLPRVIGKPPAWLCRCDCGNETHVRGTALRAGEVTRCKPCGNAVHKTHGRYGDKDFTREYMKQYHIKNREKKCLMAKIWAKNNRERHYAHGSARRAKIRGGGNSHTAEQIIELYNLQNGKCIVCRNDLNNKYHRDHILPIALGGSDDIKNIQLLCPSCNREKSAKHPVDFMQEKGFLL